MITVSVTVCRTVSSKLKISALGEDEGNESGGSGCHTDTFKRALGLLVLAVFLTLSDGNLANFAGQGRGFIEHGFHLAFHRFDVGGQLVQRIRGFMVRGVSVPINWG